MTAAQLAAALAGDEALVGMLASTASGGKSGRCSGSSGEAHPPAVDPDLAEDRGSNSDLHHRHLHNSDLGAALGLKLPKAVEAASNSNSNSNSKDHDKDVGADVDAHLL
jgi:hypothetical protein